MAKKSVLFCYANIQNNSKTFDFSFQLLGNIQKEFPLKGKRISGELFIIRFKFGQFGIFSLILFNFLKIGFSSHILKGFLKNTSSNFLSCSLLPNKHCNPIAMIKELILKNRSYRRFHEKQRLSKNQLKKWIDLARLSASARNAQSLKYLLVTEEANCDRLFPLLGWAGYLKNWSGPEKGERPAAYIVMLNDASISTNYYCDHGIAAQSILLGAVEDGFGGCIIASVDRESLIRTFSLPEHLEVIQVLALGKPSEKVVLEEMVDGDYKYWRDEKEIHHVPKRPLDEIIL